MRKFNRQQLDKAVFEVLEDRRMMSASVNFTDGVLNLNGNEPNNNTMTVRLTEDGQHIYASANGANTTVPLDDVRKIRIIGGDQSDVIRVDTKIKIKTSIRGQGGDDRIYGGGGKDDIRGGGGNDQIDGRGGNDIIVGGWGDDTLVGGTGTNTLSGGAGDDINAKQLSTPANASNPPPSQAGVDSAGADDTTGDTSGGDTTTGDTTGGDTTGGNTDNGGTTTVPGQQSGDTQAVISLMNASVVSGNAVHVNALTSSLGAGNALTTKYEWDFGDTGAKYNNLVGFNAAHVYDSAGTYTITLKITDAGGVTSTAQAQVNVAADTRRTIYVSQDGNDSNTGLSADQAIKSLDRAQSFVGSNTKILFRRGDVWSVQDSALVLGEPHAKAVSNMIIGAYGSGSTGPTFYYIGSDMNQMIRMRSDTSNVTIQDITFDSKYRPTGNIADYAQGNAVKLSGKNLTVRGCTFLNVATAINGASSPTGVSAMDNTAPLTTGLRSNFLFAKGSDYVALGNTIANSTREHGMRFAGVDRVLIAQNDITNLDRRSVDKDDYNKRTIVLQDGSYAYIVNNKLSDGPIDISTGVGAFATTGVAQRGPECKWEWSVVENNQLDNTHVNIQPNAMHVMLRDNTIQADDVVFDVTGTDPRDASRHPGDIYVLDNVAVSTSDGGNFFRTTAGASGITLEDNVYNAPANDRAVPVKVFADDLGMFTLISHNVWPDGANNYVSADDASAKAFKSESQWESYAQVKDDVYQTVSVPTGN